MASKAKKRAVKRSTVQPARPHGARPHAAPARPRPVAAPQKRKPKPRVGAAPSPPVEATPRRLYAYALAVAAIVGTLLVALSQISVHRQTGSAAQPSSSGIVGIAETAALFEGIPQRGNLLGSPTAPVRLVEYADVQCPYCAQYAVQLMPTLIERYVRTGKVQLEFRGLAFIGPGSLAALRTATAAGLQNKMWNVLDLLYRNQGAENAWVTNDLLRGVVSAAGANASRAFAARDGAPVTKQIDGWSRAARLDRISGTPAFQFGRRGAPLQRLALTALTVDQFTAALDGALAP